MLAIRLMLYLLVLTPAGSGLYAQDQAGTAASAVPPQAEQFLDSYDGQNVSSIQIAGRADSTALQYEQLFVQKTGQPFSKDKAEKTAAALKAAGGFDQVSVQIVPESNGVRVVYLVEPAVYLGIFRFPGAEQFPYVQLIQAAQYPVQAALNPAEIDGDSQALLTFLRQEGYFRADAKPQIDVDHAQAIANVEFDTTLGERAKFGTAEIEGAPQTDEAELEHKLTTLPARLRGAAIRPGKKYRRSTLTKATQYLQGSLEKKGYLGAQVKLSGADYEAATNRADIHFQADPGVITHVDISGTHLWPWTKKELLPVYQGISVDDEAVAEGQQALIAYFQSKGYFDVKVGSQLKKASDGETVIYRIDKEKKHKVTSVALSGNSTLKPPELDPQIAIEKKHLFSPGKFSSDLLQKSVNNLKAVYQSEGFSTAQVTSSVTRNGNDLQVSFKVVEGPRDIVNSIVIHGADTFPESQFAPNGLKVAAGQPYSQARAQADRASILAHYLQAGYLTASLRETANQTSNHQPHRIDVVYHIHEGPRITTGEVITLGRARTAQRLIDGDMKEIKPERPLTESGLLTAGSRLYDHTGVFDWAEVDLKEPVTTRQICRCAARPQNR